MLFFRVLLVHINIKFQWPEMLLFILEQTVGVEILIEMNAEKYQIYKKKEKKESTYLTRNKRKKCRFLSEI